MVVFVCWEVTVPSPQFPLQLQSNDKKAGGTENPATRGREFWILFFFSDNQTSRERMKGCCKSMKQRHGKKRNRRRREGKDLCKTKKYPAIKRNRNAGVSHWLVGRGSEVSFYVIGSYQILKTTYFRPAFPNFQNLQTSKEGSSLARGTLFFSCLGWALCTFSFPRNKNNNNNNWSSKSLSHHAPTTIPPPCCFSMFFFASWFMVSQVVIFSSTSWNTMVYLKVKSWRFYVRWLQHWNMHMIRALHIEIWSLKMCALRSLGPCKDNKGKGFVFFFKFVRWVCDSRYTETYISWCEKLQNLREVVEKTTTKKVGLAVILVLQIFLFKDFFWLVLVGFGWKFLDPPQKTDHYKLSGPCKLFQ